MRRHSSWCWGYLVGAETLMGRLVIKIMHGEHPAWQIEEVTQGGRWRVSGKDILHGVTYVLSCLQSLCVLGQSWVSWRTKEDGRLGPGAAPSLPRVSVLLAQPYPPPRRHQATLQSPGRESPPQTRSACTCDSVSWCQAQMR